MKVIQSEQDRERQRKLQAERGKHKVLTCTLLNSAHSNDCQQANICNYQNSEQGRMAGWKKITWDTMLILAFLTES